MGPLQLVQRVGPISAMGGGALKSEIHDRDNFSQGTAFLLLAKKMEQFYLISFNACSRKD